MSHRSKVFDISPVISENLGVFPGDTEFSRKKLLDFENGHNILLSTITTTLHIGAHADGPNHYSAGAVSIAERDPRIYMGDCLVLHAKKLELAPGGRVGWEQLDPKWRAQTDWPAARVLVRTDSFPDPDHWNSDFASFDPGLIQDFADRGVILVGIDTPSIDPETSKTLDSHAVVAKNDMAILEGIVLSDVMEGLYTLIALPLKIAGADAGPVRAVLVDGVGRLEN